MEEKTEDKPLLPKTYLYERDNEGKLIAKKVKLINKVEGKDFYVKIIPLTRGERKKIAQSGLDDKGNTTVDVDKNIVLKNCIEPKFTEDDIENAPMGLIENIVITVLTESNIKIEGDKTFKDENQRVETDFQDASTK